MEAISYHLEKFDGPLDLLISLIQKNKVNIEDIPISLICDQYMEYISAAKQLDMELASEFLVMASELMLIKSKMLLPKIKEDEEDPRAALADALIKYAQAKEAAKKLALLYPVYSGRTEKDTDEISIDKTFVADQDPQSLYTAVRRIITYNENRPKPDKSDFTPMISSPIVSVEVKIAGILTHMKKNRKTSMKELLQDAVSLPDMIAIFLGILELIKIRKILISEDDLGIQSIYGEEAEFIINEEYIPVENHKDSDTDPQNSNDDSVSELSDGGSENE